MLSADPDQQTALNDEPTALTYLLPVDHDHRRGLIVDMIVIEVLLWLGFGLILWALRQSLLQVENELVQRQHRPPAPRSASADAATRPQKLIEPIGRYSGDTIHRYAIIEGRHYQFDFVCPEPPAAGLPGNQRWIAPGLVYVESPVPSP